MQLVKPRGAEINLVRRLSSAATVRNMTICWIFLYDPLRLL